MRILHAAYDLHAALCSACSLMFRMRLYSLVCSLPNDLCGYGTKGVDACGCIGSAFNEILRRSPHWLHGESMVADFQHVVLYDVWDRYCFLLGVDIRADS